MINPLPGRGSLRLGLLAALFALGLAGATAPTWAEDVWRHSADEVNTFDDFEASVQLEAPVQGNPFVDALLDGEFQHVTPAATAPPPPVKVTGFCDSPDGQVFRARFMPRKPGTYDYTLRFRSGDQLLMHSGRFTAIDGGRPGPVRVDPEHPFHFIREGTGEHWFWNGTTTYLLLAWDDATIEQAVDRLADLGINRLRVAICGRPKDGTRWNEPLVLRSDKFSFKLEPWVAARPDDRENPGYDVTRFNVPFFHKAERLLRQARDRDVMISIIFYVDGADAGVDPFGQEGMGSEDEQRYYRYVAARFSAFSNVMWDIANEHHLFRNEDWVNVMGPVLKEADPYDHLMSVHGHGKFPFRTQPWADFAMYQSWDEHGGYQFMLNNRREQINAGRPIPQINEEYGYEDHYPYPWGQARLWPSRTAETRRRLAWEMTMAGCYQTTGERANDGVGAGLDTGGGWINGRGNSTMTMLTGYGRLRQFFEGFDWWRLEPATDVLKLPPPPRRNPPPNAPNAAPPIPVLHPDPVCLAEPGRRYVIYLPQGGAVTANLAPGAYQGRWYDPRSGEFLPEGVSVEAGEWTSPTAPSAEDWVLLIEAAGG